MPELTATPANSCYGCSSHLLAINCCHKPAEMELAISVLICITCKHRHAIVCRRGPLPGLWYRIGVQELVQQTLPIAAQIPLVLQPCETLLLLIDNRQEQISFKQLSCMSMQGRLVIKVPASHNCTLSSEMDAPAMGVRQDPSRAVRKARSQATAIRVSSWLRRARYSWALVSLERQAIPMAP
eukprot:1160392-Pelagomonas_calceolata.AAC.2